MITADPHINVRPVLAAARGRLALLVLLLWAVLLWAVLSPVRAHEFWIAPQRYAVDPGEEITATLRVGQMMRGAELPYLSSTFRAFTVATASGVHAVDGTEGGLPALSHPASEPGLHAIAYHSTPNEVTFEEWAEFLEYLADEGLGHIAEQHRARGLPQSGFIEAYTRCARSLVQVGPVSARDRDRPSGMPFEIVARQNPYSPGLQALDVTLLRDGQPVRGHQIAVYHYDGAVTRSLVTTDEQGGATIPIDRGGSFLLNATDLQPTTDSGVAWRSHWASLTFGLPVVLPEHPLDPLARIEIVRAINVMAASGRVDAATRVSLLTLAEPDKAEVLAWRPGMAPRRRALAVVRNGADVIEATVDLEAGRLDEWRAVPAVQPAIDSTEWARAQALVKADPRWLEAMRARGYEDVAGIFCESLSAGYFGRAEERERRLLKMPCYDAGGARTNMYGRPIEGLVAVVDLDASEVLRVIDSDPVPVSTRSHELEATPEAAGVSPSAAGASPGRSFSLDGRVVTWRAWSFHLGFDPRFGPVLSLVQLTDGARRRSVLYQGHLSEVFVPYMDADEGWYHRAYLDAGEYGLGTLSSPLAPGVDCPPGALYLDADLVHPHGRPYERARALCLFERAAAGPAWRHWEAATGTFSGRAGRELIVRSVPSIGNYDYIIDWVFTESGEIHVNLGATGIDAVKGVAVQSMAQAGATASTASGMLVAPNLVAVHHDHYFSFRLDLDVDGPFNGFVRERLRRVELAQDLPRRSVWRLVAEPMPAEGGFSARQGPELWRIENPALRTALGHSPSYQIQPGDSATSLLSGDDWPQRRAAFAGQTLWITAYRSGERFAAGPYPKQSQGGDGLPRYADGEPVRDADVVAWYTLGFHHLTRPQDWPVLPTLWHGFRLRPYGFLEHNPTAVAR